MPKVRFIDLFAGIGGIRKGFEIAFQRNGYETECVMTSEIKPHAYKVLNANHPEEKIRGDITSIDAKSIPDFDFLLAGFPCQAFSFAGRRFGFQDTRGTLFFEVERILKVKRPFGFILENVEGLVTHDREDPKQPIGKTLQVILGNLDALGYQVSWRVLNSKDFGLAQERKRIYIVGTNKEKVSLERFEKHHAVLADILEHGQPTIDTEFTRLLMAHFTPEQLYGKSIKDKRGGDDNIHSWDLEMKGPVNNEQKKLLNMMSHERRKKKWASMHGIDWMDGMPLTIEMIREFYQSDDLQEMLDDLVRKGYLKKEHPKALVIEHTLFGDRRIRKQDTRKKAGYNIVAGKLSFEINKILNPQGIAPTLVAMDMKKLFVVDDNGVRPLTLREGLRLFGYPDDFQFPVDQEEGFDLLGNTVAVPVIAAVADRLAGIYTKNKNKMRLTAEQVYQKLLTEDKILEKKGQIKFYFDNVDVIVKQKDVVGNIMQEWLECWLKKNGVEYAPSDNTQMPPDFFLNPDDKTQDLLEVKAFNYEATPGFDIADFNAYQSELIDKPYMIHAKYLVFGYKMQDDGYVVIKKVWLKNVWDICRRMEKWPLNLQIKDKVVHKIRPGVWYSESKRIKFKTFTCMEDFIAAIEETVYKNPKTHDLGGEWLESFLKSYKKKYGAKLTIPRWSKIKDQYVKKKGK